jgi:hypothetical protein
MAIEILPAMGHFMKQCGKQIPHGSFKVNSIDVDVLLNTEGIPADNIMTQIADLGFLKGNGWNRHGLFPKKGNVKKIHPPVKFPGKIT